MSSAYFESNRIGDVSRTEVRTGNVTATLKQVGDTKSLKCTGRGNVRQAKALAKELHKTIQ